MTNSIASENVALLGVISPAALAAAATTSGWVPVKGFHSILVIVATGVLGAGATVDVTFQQATAAAGTGSKALSGKTVTQLVKATNDTNQVMINLRGEEFDVNGGFDYLQVTVTVGAAISQGAVVILGVGARYGPARLANPASVVQVVA